MKRFFVDAETDGLYGPFLSIAAMVTDENGVELDRFYASVNVSCEQLNSEWVRANVYPDLKNAEMFFDTEAEMLEAFWKFWMKHRADSICIAYVQYPVEARLFTRCVMKNTTERAFLGPFPLYDLSTLLVSKGFSFDVNIQALSGLNLKAHDAMNDVRMLASVWNKLDGE
ncbi:MAG: hypothetical protein E7603_09785 [Ruminococcaceae bacterium]|nr:hypothetical protein [Oscillospiraceae bacterium]